MVQYGSTSQSPSQTPFQYFLAFLLLSPALPPAWADCPSGRTSRGWCFCSRQTLTHFAVFSSARPWHSLLRHLEPRTRSPALALGSPRPLWCMQGMWLLEIGRVWTRGVLTSGSQAWAPRAVLGHHPSSVLGPCAPSRPRLCGVPAELLRATAPLRSRWGSCLCSTTEGWPSRKAPPARCPQAQGCDSLQLRGPGGTPGRAEAALWSSLSKHLRKSSHQHYGITFKLLREFPCLSPLLSSSFSLSLSSCLCFPQKLLGTLKLAEQQCSSRWCWV